MGLRRSLEKAAKGAMFWGALAGSAEAGTPERGVDHNPGFTGDVSAQLEKGNTQLDISLPIDKTLNADHYAIIMKHLNGPNRTVEIHLPHTSDIAKGKARQIAIALLTESVYIPYIEDDRQAETNPDFVENSKKIIFSNRFTGAKTLKELMQDSKMKEKIEAGVEDMQTVQWEVEQILYTSTKYEGCWIGHADGSSLVFQSAIESERKFTLDQLLNDDKEIGSLIRKSVQAHGGPGLKLINHVSREDPIRRIDAGDPVRSLQLTLNVDNVRNTLTFGGPGEPFLNLERLANAELGLEEIRKIVERLANDGNDTVRINLYKKGGYLTGAETNEFLRETAAPLLAALELGGDNPDTLQAKASRINLVPQFNLKNPGFFNTASHPFRGGVAIPFTEIERFCPEVRWSAEQIKSRWSAKIARVERAHMFTMHELPNGPIEDFTTPVARFFEQGAQLVRQRRVEVKEGLEHTIQPLRPGVYFLWYNPEHRRSEEIRLFRFADNIKGMGDLGEVYYALQYYLTPESHENMVRINDGQWQTARGPVRILPGGNQEEKAMLFLNEPMDLQWSSATFHGPQDGEFGDHKPILLTTASH